jgi:hypothetical protein
VFGVLPSGIYIRSARVEGVCIGSFAEFHVRTTIAGIAIGSLAAVTGCSTSTAPASCSVPKTAAAFRDIATDSFTVATLSHDGSSRLMVATSRDATSRAGSVRLLVSDTTPVYLRVSNEGPIPTFVCNLAVGEVVEIPFTDGFGDFTDPRPTIVVSQVVIDPQAN